MFKVEFHVCSVGLKFMHDITKDVLDFYDRHADSWNYRYTSQCSVHAVLWNQAQSFLDARLALYELNYTPNSVRHFYVVGIISEKAMICDMT